MANAENTNTLNRFIEKEDGSIAFSIANLKVTDFLKSVSYIDEEALITKEELKAGEEMQRIFYTEKSSVNTVIASGEAHYENQFSNIGYDARYLTKAFAEKADNAPILGMSIEFDITKSSGKNVKGVFSPKVVEEEPETFYGLTFCNYAKDSAGNKHYDRILKLRLTPDPEDDSLLIVNSLNIDGSWFDTKNPDHLKNATNVILSMATNIIAYHFVNKKIELIKPETTTFGAPAMKQTK